MSAILAFVVQAALQITLTAWVIRRDMRRLPAAQLARSWNDASFWVAVVVFSPFSIPVHFTRTRRSLRGFALGVAWMAVVVAGGAALDMVWPQETQSPRACAVCARKIAARRPDAGLRATHIRCMHMLRDVVHEARASVSNGSCLHVARTLGTRSVGILDPFLLLDELFTNGDAHATNVPPEEPHSGVEIVTYLMSGALWHRDTCGAARKLLPGDVHWMTTARGVVSHDAPLPVHGTLRGFRLWINQPAAMKPCAPVCRTFTASAVVRDGARVRIIAEAPVILDVTLEPRSRFVKTLPTAHSAFAYVFDGNADIGGRWVPRGHIAVLGRGDRVAVHAGEAPSRLLLVAGAPICEPIVWSAGPLAR